MSLTAALCGTAVSDDIATLGIDDEVVRELVADETHRYSLTANETVRVVVENRGRGTILTALDDSSVVVFRAANWRQTEGKYVAVILPGEATTLVIDADEPIAPRGNYRIRIHRIGRSSALYRAERSMTLASNALLRHFFGDADGRRESISLFEAAIAGFREANDTAREADAWFELAGAYFNLGEHNEAAAAYRRARNFWTELADSRGQSSADTQLGLIAWRTNRLDEALQLFQSVADRRRALGDHFYTAQALNNVGLVYRDLDDPYQAVSYFQSALALWQGSADLDSPDTRVADFASLDEPPWLSHSLVAMNNLGWAYEITADPVEAERVLENALKLSRDLGRKRLTAELQNNLGRLKYKFGELQAALEYLDSAIAYFESGARDEIWAGNARQSRALVFRATGEFSRAATDLRVALAHRTDERDPARRAETLLALAELGLARKEPDEAIERTGQAQTLLAEYGNVARTQALASELRAQAHLQLGERQQARESIVDALRRFSDADDVRGLAGARASYAAILSADEAPDDALVQIEAALDIAQRIDDRLLSLRLEALRAQTYFKANRIDAARLAATRAIELSEKVRSQLSDPVLRRYFSSTQRKAYEVLVNAAIRGEDVEGAWRLANTGRARRFTELLESRVTGAGLRSQADKIRFQALLQTRAAKAEARIALLSKTYRERSEPEQRRLDRLDAELSDIAREIDELLVGGDRRHVAQQFELTDLQAQLSERDIVLQYFIGSDESHVWRIDRSGIRHRRIDNQESIAAKVSAVGQSIRARRAYSVNDIRYLSEQLLLGLSEGSRVDSHLVIVPDGPLYLLPFSLLLPDTAAGNEPLVASMEVSYVPTLSLLRQVERSRSNPTPSIAIIADPVYSADDPRVAENRQRARQVTSASASFANRLLERSAARAGIDRLERLPGTAQEARAIRSLAGNREVFVALGLEANRDLVLSGVLSGTSILHFATHGIVDRDEPSLSGLVLSGFDENGTAVARFLRAQDIASLKLDAHLVVLSGCETGQGRVVDIEGLVGLSQAFLQAGSRQVVSSLWRVPDQATAVLMKRFYEEMLQHGQPPVSALRIAKDAMRTDRRWRDPYYWASFTLQGDWR